MKALWEKLMELTEQQAELFRTAVGRTISLWSALGDLETALGGAHDGITDLVEGFAAGTDSAEDITDESIKEALETLIDKDDELEDED